MTKAEAFAEWVLKQAKEQGLAIVGFVGVAPANADEKIEFEPFGSELSLLNLAGLDDELGALREKLIAELTEAIRSYVETYMTDLVATAAGY